jgi:hypothetical protein
MYNINFYLSENGVEIDPMFLKKYDNGMMYVSTETLRVG